MACTVRIVQESSKPSPSLATTSAAKPDSAKKDLPWKPWAEVTKEAESVPGLFTAYLKRESVFLAIKPGQFDHDYLLVTELAQGLGDLGPGRRDRPPHPTWSGSTAGATRWS